MSTIEPQHVPVHPLIRPSSDDARRHLADIRPALEAIHTGEPPPLSCVALPDGLDRRLLKTQPFSVRTWNCLANAGLFDGSNHILVEHLLSIRNFGATSLHDLLLVVENYLKECARNNVPSLSVATEHQHVTPDSSVRPSSSDARRHLAEMDAALASVREGNPPPLSCVCLPNGLDRSLLKTQPFRSRTYHCLNARGLFTGDNQILVGDLLKTRNFGRTSLHDLLVVVENYLKKCVREPGVTQNASEDTFREPLGKLLAAAFEFHDATSIADLLAPEVAQIASAIGVYNDLKAVDVDTISADHASISATVLTEAQQLYENAPRTHQIVLDRRIIASPPDSLADVGHTLGVSRERVRQIHTKLKKKCQVLFGRELRMISFILKLRFGAIVVETDVDSRIDRLISDDGTPGAALARQAIKRSLGYTRTMNGVCLDTSACAVVDHLRRAAPNFVEDGIIDQSALMKAVLPGQEWEQHWQLLLKCCEFYNFFGFLAMRDSDRARTKAALLSIGTPATREEISVLCGINEARVGTYLSGFPNVVRADMSRWGLSEWIDDEYEGIEAEIIQRIEEGGGVTTTTHLFNELPEKFGVSAVSVSAYLQRPIFAVHDNGHVTLAGAPSDRSPVGGIRIPHLPNEWKVQTRLRCGAVCGFGLSPRITQDLLNIRGVSLLELYFYLEHAIKDDQLSKIFKTTNDRQVVKTAYTRFLDAIVSSRRDGRVSSEKMEWIIPYDYATTSRPTDGSVATLIADIFESTYGSNEYLENVAGDVNEWLPWMPLAAVKHLRNWNSSKISALHRALFKLARDVDKLANAYYPWEPAFSLEARLIPIQALYQYEASSGTLDGIGALHGCGLTSVNDLRCLHPNAVVAAKHEDEPLLRIYRALNVARHQY